MAVIDNLNASITSFKVNGSNKNLQDCIGTYGTSGILNGGETYDELLDALNILSYSFQVSGLLNHTIKSVIVNSLLLDSKGELVSTKRFLLTLDGVLVNADINGNPEIKTIHSTIFNLNKEITETLYQFNLELVNSSSKSCYYGLESVVILLDDINYKIHLGFFGPNRKRTSSSIKVSAILQNLEAVNVTFSKDSVNNFNAETDFIEGLVYFKKDGIYVDDYQYGTVAPATTSNAGIVKLADTLDFLDGILVNDYTGIAATPLLVLDTLLRLDTLVKDGILAPADSDTYGILKLSESHFKMQDVLDEDGNVIGQEIVAPEELGVAASTLLVFNVLATAKNYTDEQIAPILEFLDGIEAPLSINIENDEGEKESLGEELTFSNDFENRDKKLYIKWLEII